MGSECAGSKGYGHRRHAQPAAGGVGRGAMRAAALDGRALVLCAARLIAAACGGSSSTPTTPSTNSPTVTFSSTGISPGGSADCFRRHGDVSQRRLAPARGQFRSDHHPYRLPRHQRRRHAQSRPEPQHRGADDPADVRLPRSHERNRYPLAGPHHRRITRAKERAARWRADTG